MAFLSVSYGNEPGRTIPLDGARVVLGRATECDVVLDLPSASRLHACVVREKNAYYLEDLNSRHGTFLNGERLQGRARLRDKDRITIADRDLTFHEGTPQAPPPTDKTAVDAPLVESSRPSPPSKEHSSDLRSAAQIQRALLLGRPTIDLKSQLRADAISIPALAVGGDFYDFFAYDQVLDMVIGDVMGKGVQAALVGAATRLHLLRAINNLLASNPGRLPEPKDILGLVVADVYQHFTDIGTFVTLCYARFDLGERRVQIVDCGHTKTVHVRRDGTCELLHGENVPLGWLRADDYNGFTVPLEVDDLFFFYTDGMTEARKGEEDFGEARLTGLVGSLYGLDPRELVTRVSKEILAFSAPQPPNDDVTCAAVQILDPNRSRGSLKEKLEISSDPRQAPQAVALLRELCQKSPDLTTFTEDLNQLQQAVSEVLKYIVEHAYSGQTDRPIRIEASLFVNRFTVRIYHRGEDFNFTTAKPLQETPRRVDAAQCSRSTYGEQCVSLEKRLTR